MRALLPCFLALALLTPAAASAQEEEDGGTELTWDSHWSRVHWGEYPVIAAMLTYPQWARLVFPSRTNVSGKFSGGVLFDEPVRDLIRLHDRSARDVAGTISDWLWHITQHYWFVMDTMVVALILRDSPDVAWNMFWVGGEAMGIASVISWTARRFGERERPSGLACEEDPTYANDCDHPGRFNSFFSGHVAMAFTGAGLICANHENIPLYGGGWADRIPCIAAVASGSTIALLRMMTDRHWFSDVFVGAAVGIGFGYLWPSLVRFRGEDGPADPQDDGDGEDDVRGRRRQPAVRAMVVPFATEDSIGAQVVGVTF